MKCPKLFVFLFHCIYIPDLCRSQHDHFAGPFRFVVQRIDQCDESGTRQIYVTGVRISKLSRTKYVYRTNLTAEILIDDNVLVEVDIAKFGNGGWRPHYMQLEFPEVCTSLKTMMPPFYVALKNALKIDCPFPPGTYPVEDLDMGSLKLGQSIPSFPYGRYRSDFSGWFNGTLIGCIRYYNDVIPLRTERPHKKPKNSS